MSQGNSAGRKRVLVVEDELMIRMLLQDMLDDLGHTLAGEAGRIDEAMRLAKQAEFDVAILDVNLNGEPISPVVEVLVQRGLPFVFATGEIGSPFRFTSRMATSNSACFAKAIASSIRPASPARV